MFAQRAQQQRGAQQAADTMTRRAPDGQQEAYVQNYNLYVRPVGSRTGTALTTDGSEGGAYTLQSVSWSPDSKKLAAYRVTPGYQRIVHYVESSPGRSAAAEVHAIARTRSRATCSTSTSRCSSTSRNEAADARRQCAVSKRIPDARTSAWRNDSRAFTFEYNQRGHQVYRVIEVDAATRQRARVISEEPKTFFYYRTANGSLSDSGNDSASTSATAEKSSGCRSATGGITCICTTARPGR